MTALLLSLLVAAPAPFHKTGDDESLSSLELARIRRWKETLPPQIAANPKLYFWMLFIDARPQKHFRRFAGERLSLATLQHSSLWAETFFRDVANPHANKVLPSAYFLSNERHTSSLLQFEWKAGGYGFILQESDRAMLLRVQPGRIQFSPKEGISVGRVLAILGDVLSKDVTDQGDLDKQFRPPLRMRPGSFASNASRKDLGLPLIFDWRKQILVFVTDTDLCVLLFKKDKDGKRDHIGIDEKYWLPAVIVTRDGKSLLIDELRNTKPRRAVPEKTVKIPR